MNRRIVLGAGVVAAATAGWIALPGGKHPLTVAAATDRAGPCAARKSTMRVAGIRRRCSRIWRRVLSIR